LDLPVLFEDWFGCFLSEGDTSVLSVVDADEIAELFVTDFLLLEKLKKRNSFSILKINNDIYMYRASGKKKVSTKYGQMDREKNYTK